MYLLFGSSEYLYNYGFITAGNTYCPPQLSNIVNVNLCQSCQNLRRFNFQNKTHLKLKATFCYSIIYNLLHSLAATDHHHQLKYCYIMTSDNDGIDNITTQQEKARAKLRESFLKAISELNGELF